MIPVSEAIKIVLAQTKGLPIESVPLAHATGRVLAQEIIADSDLPPFDRAQMDGYAVRAADVASTPARLRIVGESAAGAGWHQEMKAGEGVRIMTGAPVPAGADAVQQVELTRETDSNSEVEILESLEVGRSIVKRAAEIKSGETVLRGGEEINVAMIATLASFGYARVKVGRRPRVAVMATGSELVDVDQKPAQDQIRDSNNFTIAAYATLAGAIVERLPLRPAKLPVFARLGITLVFGLPGNPVSVAVTFNLFARTALRSMQGASQPTLNEETAILGRSVKGSGDRESYLPAVLRTDGKGSLIAEPLKWGGSSDFVAFARATALINVAAGVKSIEAGERVKIVKLP